MGGMTGYQIIYRQEMPQAQPDVKVEPVIFAVRVACRPVDDKTATAYAMRLVEVGKDVKEIQEIMDTIVSGFTILEPATQPVGKTGKDASTAPVGKQ